MGSLEDHKEFGALQSQLWGTGIAIGFGFDAVG